jgi:peroxiredoxin
MWRSTFVWIALFSAAAMVAVLGWQNRGLRADRDLLTDRLQYAYPGMYVPQVDAQALDGGMLALGTPAQDRQVLFFFNHTCPHCRTSAPSVVSAANRIAGEFGRGVAVIGVCQCEPAQAREYARTHGFGFPIVTLRDPRSLALYRARGVPALLVIDRDGRVRHAVQGVFDTREQIENLLAELRRKDAPPRPRTGS